MGRTTGITWTNATWNPWQGCHKASAGCANCYMYREKKQYGQDPSAVVRSKSQTFNAPPRWARKEELPLGARIFVCSWSDFFIKEADPWRDEAWEIIGSTPQFNYLLLTKRPERIVLPWEQNGTDPWANVWLGVTAENQEMANLRIPQLLKHDAYIRWVSIEPMLGPVNLIDAGVSQGGANFVDWVIYGAESLANHSPGRPCNLAWIEGGLLQCKLLGVAAFVKQIEVNGKLSTDPAAWPEILRVQQFPV